MKSMMSRIAQVITILALLAGAFGMSGCGNGSTEGNTTNAPRDPISVDLSFPNGAPRLNQAAELRCTVRIRVITENITIKIDLPDGLEYVSGNLSWSGAFSRDDVREIKAVIRPVRPGNYTIEAILTPGYKNSWNFEEGGGRFPIYLAVSESSADWGIYPPWLPKKAPPPSVTPAPPAEHLPAQ